MHMKLMTCRHHLHLNLTIQGHTINAKLDHAIPCLGLHPCLLLCFPCRYLTLAPETAEETYVELSDTEPEDTVGAASTTLPGKGENLCHYFITFRSCLAVVLERYCLILSTSYAMLNPYIHDPHNPANQCTARLPLLSHCLVWIENLLLTLYDYG